MIKIAWVISGFYSDENDFGGAAAIHLLAKEISSNPEIDLTVFALYHPQSVKEFRLYNIKVITLNKCSPKTKQPQGSVSKLKKLRAWSLFRKKFADENKKGKFNVIHSFWAGEPGYNALYAAKKYGIPLVANICGGEMAAFPSINYGLQLKKFQKYFIDKTIAGADIIACGSDYIAEKTIEIYGTGVQNRIRKLPFGVDTGVFKLKTCSKSVRDHANPVLINISHAIPVKGHLHLLEAIEEVKKYYPGLKLNIYGYDPGDNLKKEINNRNLSGSIIVKGFIDYKMIPDALMESDLFVLSSIYESQNMSMLEAAFAGLPVVSTDAGVAKEITPYVSVPGDVSGLAENIINALRSSKIEYKMLHERFSLKVSAENFISLYKKISK